MRTLVGDDEFVQPKRNETAPRSECRPTLKNALTQPRLLEMAEYTAYPEIWLDPDRVLINAVVLTDSNIVPSYRAGWVFWRSAACRASNPP